MSFYSSPVRVSPGKKGIGFKSVFKITDTPIIHSAGWHFQFNARLKLDRVNIKEQFLETERCEGKGCLTGKRQP